MANADRVRLQRNDPAKRAKRFLGGATLSKIISPYVVLALREGVDVLVAEVWPSMWPTTAAPGEFKDQAQVRTTAEALALMDDKGELSKAFGPKKGTDDALIAQVQDEEGWILGV